MPLFSKELRAPARRRDMPHAGACLTGTPGGCQICAVPFMNSGAVMFKSAFVSLALGLLVLPVQTRAQSNAQSIAAALQSWRDACGDPNPDLVIGYLADAVATNNINIRKACMRQVFASDNADLRNAALRIAIAALPRLRFRVEKPERPGNLYESVQTGLVFQAANGDAGAGTATWYTTISNLEPDEEYSGTVAVLGPGIVWEGPVKWGSGTYKCQLSADLAERSRLNGTLHCGNLGTYQVAAELMD